MGLTRPRFSQFDTTISSISDPITVLNKSSTRANIDIGFIMNRNGGALSNVAVFWQESGNTFVLAFTSNTGEVTGSVSNSNVAISTYANLQVNTLNTTFVNATGNVSASQLNTKTLVARNDYGNINFTQFNSIFADANASQNIVVIQASTTGLSDGMGMYASTGLASRVYSSRGIAFATGVTVRNTDTPTGGVILVAVTAAGDLWANATTPSTNTTTGALVVAGGVGVGGNINAGNVSAAYFTGSGQFLTGLPASYSNVNVKAYTESMGFQNYGNTNVIAYTESMGFQNYGNTNVIAYTQSMGFQNYGNVNLVAYLGGAVTVGGNLTVQGNLIVQGTTTTLNSTTLDVSDLNITVAKGAASAAAANGAGLTVDGASATLLYTSATDTWNINKGLVVGSAGNVTINNTAVTTNTTTGALTVAGGVGIAGTISVGGTLLAGNVSGTAGQVLTSTGAGLTWSTAGGGSANQPFSLTSNDFGSDLSGYTVSEDQGDLSAGSTSYDLAYIATLGPITASLLELPSYTTSALPTGQTGGALAYDSSVQNVKFNNGTTWANIAPTYYQIDDLGLGFDGITTSFALTYNNGASISPTNPNQLKIRIGGVDISPFRYADDLVNLSEIARFDRGFRIVSGNIAFASPPSPGMEFYGTVQANEEAEPQFVFKQTPFSAINIQYGY